MKVFLVFVTTADGKITKWGDPVVRAWTSKEDQKYFYELMSTSALVVSGSNSFLAQPVKPKANRLLIVLTRHPEDYRNYQVNGQIEFTVESPLQLVNRLSEQGYDQMLVAGGPHVATSFLKENLVDEIWLTIEPLVFGTGGSFVIEEQLDIRLRLISADRMNEQGTLLLKYAVQR